jgi:hypothetical protein
MPATSTRQVHLLTQRAARSPPHPAWRQKVAEDTHHWAYYQVRCAERNDTAPLPVSKHRRLSPACLDGSAEQRGSNGNVAQSVLGPRVALPTPTTLHCVTPFEA